MHQGSAQEAHAGSTLDNTNGNSDVKVQGSDSTASADSGSWDHVSLYV